MSWGTAGTGAQLEHTCNGRAALPGLNYHRTRSSHQARIALRAYLYSRKYTCRPCATHNVQHGKHEATVLMTSASCSAAIYVSTCLSPTSANVQLGVSQLLQAVSLAGSSKCNREHDVGQRLWLRTRQLRLRMRRKSRAWALRHGQRCRCWSGLACVRTLRALRPPRSAGKPRWSSRSAPPLLSHMLLPLLFANTGRELACCTPQSRPEELSAFAYFGSPPMSAL